MVGKSFDIGLFKNKKIIFTVLNWGIGHATRSIPLIHQLQKNGNEVLIISDGEALNVLKISFPDQEIKEIPSYNISYPQKGSFTLGMLRQSFQIIKAIKSEKEAITLIAKSFRPDILISDNRYGCYLEDVPSYIITHQLQLMYKNPLKKWLSHLIINYLVRPFDAIWIPDHASINLSGAMTHPKMVIPKYFIGLHTSLKIEDTPLKNSVMIMLSGPEPRRSQLENTFLELIPKVSDSNFILVAGNFKNPYHTYQKANLEYHRFLDRTQIAEKLGLAHTVFCRSGYTSLMDLFCNGFQNIYCIPTKGQIEQEYLAKYLTDRKVIKGYCDEDQIEDWFADVLK
jgi:uncharacterized protein (TIGR00661 family)